MWPMTMKNARDLWNLRRLKVGCSRSGDCGAIFRALVKIDHSFRSRTLHHVAMKITEKEALAVRCPTCGAKPGEKCELSTGLPRTDPHRDRRLVASDK